MHTELYKMDWVFKGIVSVLFISFISTDASIESESNSDEGYAMNFKPSGESKIRTNLNLSPWELFVLTDLSFKIISRQCSSLKSDVIAGFKGTLSEAYKQAPAVQVQNEHFLPSYSSMVRCLDHLEEREQASEKQAREESPVVLDIASAENDWTAQDVVVLTESTTAKPSSQSDLKDGQMATSWLWGFRKLSGWMSKLMTVFNSIDDEDEKGSGSQTEFKKQSENRIDIAYRQARQNYANFFHRMSKIIEKSCPIIHRPDKVFIRKAFMDMNIWATLDKRPTIAGATLWFRKEQLLKNVETCSNDLK